MKSRARSSRWRGAALGLAAGFCVATPAASARVVEKIAAVVGGEIILSSEVEEKSAPFLAQIASITDATERNARATTLRREVLDRLIDDELITQQAVEMKLNVSSEEIDRSVESIKKEHNLSDEQLRQALTQQGMTMASYRQDVKRQILRFRVLNLAVGAKTSISDEDVKSHYERHVKQGSDFEVRASHIFVAIPDGADTAVVLEKRTIADGLRERAKKGEDFAALAKTYSEDAATRNEGGDLGYFGKDLLPKAIEEVVFSMKPGEVRGPVRADRGFHVLKLVDRRDKPAKKFDDVKDEIRNQLRTKAVEKQTKTYLDDLREKTLVDERL